MGNPFYENLSDKDLQARIDERGDATAVEEMKRRLAVVKSETGTIDPPDYLSDMAWDPEDLRRINSMGSPQASALSTAEVGTRYANEDPLTSQLMGKAAGAINGLDPQTYVRLQQLAEQQQRNAAANLAKGRGESYRAIRGLSDMPSVVDRQAAIARDDARRAIGARLASQRGGYSPAAQRAAMMATGDAMAGIGSQALAARAAEERAAKLAQVGAWDQFRGGDRADAGMADNALRTQGLFAEAGDNLRGTMVNAATGREGQLYDRFERGNQIEQGVTAQERAQPSTFERVVDTAAKVVGAGAGAASLFAGRPNVGSATQGLTSSRLDGAIDDGAYMFEHDNYFQPSSSTLQRAKTDADDDVDRFLDEMSGYGSY